MICVPAAQIEKLTRQALHALDHTACHIAHCYELLDPDNNLLHDVTQNDGFPFVVFHFPAFLYAEDLPLLRFFKCSSGHIAISGFRQVKAVFDLIIQGL